MERKETTVSLKEHFEKLLLEKDKAINIALASAKEAVLVAETNSEKWRANANEWRGAMTDRERNFLTNSEFIAYKEAKDKELDKYVSEIKVLELWKSNQEGRQARAQFIAIIAVLVSIVAVIKSFFS